MKAVITQCVNKKPVQLTEINQLIVATLVEDGQYYKESATIHVRLEQPTYLAIRDLGGDQILCAMSTGIITPNFLYIDEETGHVRETSHQLGNTLAVLPVEQRLDILNQLTLTGKIHGYVTIV